MNVPALIEMESQEPIRVHQEALLWGKMCWRRARSLCVKSVLDVLWTSELGLWVPGRAHSRNVLRSVVHIPPGMEENV